MNINEMKILSVFNEINPLLTIKEYTKSLSLNIDSFTQTKEALLFSKSIKYDLLILEHTPSKLDGLAFLKTFRHIHRETPVLILIESNDIALQEKAIKQGAFDVVCMPLSPVLFQAKVQNTLIQTKAKTLVDNRAIHLQDEIQNATKSFKDSENELLEILGKTTNYKEHQQSTHTKLISHYARALARLAGLNEKIQDVAFRASGLYDLGKVAIADEILLKKAKLTDDEFEVVKAHARIGYDLLKYTQNSYLKAAAVISYSHHEKYDGSGYPIGLSGETIPILGRIVAIVDVFEALTSKRVYNELWSVEDACSFLIKEKGKHFDPLFVDLFIDNLDEMLAIKNKLNCTT